MQRSAVAGTILKDRTAHADYLKSYFFRAESVYKSCERRKFSRTRHRSSNAAERLRANKDVSRSNLFLLARFRILFALRVRFVDGIRSGMSLRDHFMLGLQFSYALAFPFRLTDVLFRRWTVVLAF